jgi:hypothetical protein
MPKKPPTLEPNTTAVDDNEPVAFLHTILAQCGLPRDAVEGRIFTRTNGSASLRLEAGAWWNGLEWIDQPLPYGTRPRLVLIHACSEAVRTRSREIEVEHSVRAFLRRLGIDAGGYNMGKFKRQMLALVLGYTAGAKVINTKVDPVEQFDAWLQDDDDGQKVMWPGVLTLSEPFFKTLTKAAVPLDQRAIATLQNSALALDVYTWLAHRLCRINRAAGVTLPWSALREQFGQEYRDTNNFKRELRRVLQRVLAAYPDAKVESIRGGLRLKPSKPPIARKGHLVALPAATTAPASEPSKPAALPRRYVSEDALDQLRKVAPGRDRQALLAKYMD